MKTKTYSSSIIGKRLFTKQDLYISNEVPTLTTMYRKDLLDLYFKEINIPNLLMGDYPMWLYFNEKANYIFWMKLQVFTVFWLILHLIQNQFRKLLTLKNVPLELENILSINITEKI